MTKLRQRMLEDLRIRNYAPTTVDCYVRSVAEFAKHFNRSPDQMGPEELRQWQLYLLNERKVKRSTFIFCNDVRLPVAQHAGERYIDRTTGRSLILKPWLDLVPPEQQHRLVQKTSGQGQKMRILLGAADDPRLIVGR